MDTKRNFEHFSTRKEQRIFRTTETELMAGLREEKINSTMPEENIMRYHHGAGWYTHGVDEDVDTSGRFEIQSIVAEVKFEDITNQKLDVPAYYNKMATDMHRMHMELLYKTINESTEKSGNIVSAKQEGSIPNMFLAMLRKIEFGVDKKGNISIPEIHADSEMAEKMARELTTQGPEFEAEVEKIKAEKSAKAMEREAERVAKFKGYKNE